MLKHVKTIGNFTIVQNELFLDAGSDIVQDTHYIVRNKRMDVDMFTSLEKAEQFITEVLQKYNEE